MIRQRLSKNEAFGQDLGLRSYDIIEIAGARMHQKDLFSAARKASREHPTARVRVMNEGEAAVKWVENRLLLEIRHGEETSEAPLDILELFNEEQLHRTNALERVVTKIGPTIDLNVMRQVAQDRQLSDDEAGIILEALVHGIFATQSRLENDLRNGKARLTELIPDSLEYFETLCGPDPGDLKPGDYLTAVLPEYRKVLLQRDLGQGLKLCLLGALREDLCPALWVSEVDNDQLWEYLNDSQPELDPFSLLAALDLALYRQDDERFSSFAESAVGLLTADKFTRSDGVDAYSLISALAKLVLNRIQLMEGGSLRQPFWKRMCAWMQAALVARLMHGSGVDLESLTSLVEQNLLLAGGYASTVDLRREPMVEAGTVSSFGLRREVLGRLVALQARHQAAGRPTPRIDDIRNALERIAGLGPPLSVLLPGPLKGYLRPQEQGKEIPKQDKERLHEVSEDLLISNLANLSQHFAIPKDLKSALREAISTKAPGRDDMSLESIVTRLWHSGNVAAVERDGDLAQVIAAGVLRVAAEIQEETLLWGAVETLLRSAAAFEAENAWAEWLEIQFFELANRLPAGKISELLWHHIQALKKVTRLELGIFRRAEAVASAGFP